MSAFRRSFLIAPRARSGRTSPARAYELHRQPFGDKGIADIAAVDSQRSAGPAVVAFRGAFRSGRAGAGNRCDPGLPAGDKLPEAGGRACAQFRLPGAFGAASVLPGVDPADDREQRFGEAMALVTR